MRRNGVASSLGLRAKRPIVRQSAGIEKDLPLAQPATVACPTRFLKDVGFSVRAGASFGETDPTARILTFDVLVQHRITSAHDVNHSVEGEGLATHRLDDVELISVCGAKPGNGSKVVVPAESGPVRQDAEPRALRRSTIDRGMRAGRRGPATGWLMRGHLVEQASMSPSACKRIDEHPGRAPTDQEIGVAGHRRTDRHPTYLTGHPLIQSQPRRLHQLIRSPMPAGAASLPHFVLNRAIRPARCWGGIPVSIELTFPMSLMLSPHAERV